MRRAERNARPALRLPGGRGRPDAVKKESPPERKAFRAALVHSRAFEQVGRRLGSCFCGPDEGVFVFKEKALCAECGLQFVEPDGFGVVFGEEGAGDPVGVAPLEELEGEDFFALYLAYAYDVHFARPGGHRGAAHGAGYAADLLVGIAEDVPGALQWHGEVVLCPGIACDEEVVGDAAERYLLLPHAGPGGSRVVDLAHHRRLGADDGASIEHPPDGGFHGFGLQLCGAVEVGHEGNVYAGLAGVLESAQQAVGVVVLSEPLRPIAEGFGAEAYGAQVGELGVYQGLYVGIDDFRLHDQGVAPGEEDVRHFGVCTEVFDDELGVAHGKFELVHAYKLRPAEAKGAVGVAGLPLTGEEEHGLPVFVLHAGELGALYLRYILGALPGRVGVELHPDFVGDELELGLARARPDGFGHLFVMGRLQHILLRESEDVDGVVLVAAPVDELLYDVVVGFEGQYVADHFNIEALFFGEVALYLRDITEIA